MATIVFGIMVLLFALGTPIAFALAASALAGALYDGTISLTILPQRIFAGLDSFPLLACPLFILAGDLMSAGSMSARLVRFASALVGHLRGSLAMITVVSEMIFSGVSGSATADTAAIGSITIPAMIKQGYNPDFAAALLASAGTLGPIIPPSTVMIIFGYIANVSVAALFMGGIIPGILIGLGFMFISYLHARRGGEAYLGGERATWNTLWWTSLEALPAFGMMAIIFGGILGGVFTPTEAAAVAAIYAFMVELLIYRDVSLAGLPSLLLNSVKISSIVMLILATSMLFAWVITFAEIPQQVTRLLVSISSSPVIFLILVNILLLIVGTFMESIAAMIILIPILAPAANQYGLDPVHFGVIVSVNLCIGMITPPLGVTLFVASSISKRPVVSIVPPLLPFIAIEIVMLLVITYIPETVLFLPRLLRLM